jgi:hypothetical protein
VIRPEKKRRVAAALKYILDTDGDALINTSSAAVFLTDASQGKFYGVVCKDHLSSAALCENIQVNRDCGDDGKG